MDTHSAQAIQAWLVSRLSDALQIHPDDIDVREPFSAYGLGSTEAVSLSGELGDWLGRNLSADLAYEYSTIESLSGFLASSDATSGSCDIGGRDTELHAQPVAIIGIGCRFPGAHNPDAFWKLLCDGTDAITEVPAQRFDLDSCYDSDPAVPGKINTRWGGFVHDVDRFDAHFFGISPREAARMDPQQRLLLEVTWEALEDAGLVPDRLTGTPTGVFVGISNNDYGRIQLNDLTRIDAYAGTGNALSIAANRISYLFDLRGPSIAVDTACSSSLVAVHLACNSLRNGESTLAIAAGVNLILSPAVTVNFTKAGVMAPDGRCKSFDARANGYVRGEGAGVVILKPLAQAIADADPIYAVIRGSAVNQDGRSNGLMAPNPAAQEAVLREAYRHAGVSPGQVQYIEAHGTGTLLGDPIEAKALGKVLATGRHDRHLCAIGSVKTNIGHLEAAAGIAGLIKTALSLKHRQIPASLHFIEPNPLIPFEELPLRVQTTVQPWPMTTSPALAGVSSFGFGGTNAHVVLTEAAAFVELDSAGHLQSHDATFREVAYRPNCVLALSGRSPEALQAKAHSYKEFLGEDRSESLRGICYTADVRRGHHDYRLAMTANSLDRMIEGLDSFTRGEKLPGLSFGRRSSSRSRKLVFVLSGQGSQWLGMGRNLLRRYSVFRDALVQCDRALRPYCEWSLLAELNVTDPAISRLHEIDVLQPVLFAMQVGLAALWASWGVDPDAVVGHSMGEVAAAYIAGALTLEDAARVICFRSRLIMPTVGHGAMAAVDLSLADANCALNGYEGRISVGLSNSPASSVLSGDPVALSHVIGSLEAEGVFCRMVAVDFAAHSAQMVPLQAELSRYLTALAPGPANIPIYSTVTGDLIDGREFTASYWAKNLREQVLFADAIQHLLQSDHDTYLELSPHPILLGAIQQGARHAKSECVTLPSIRREENDSAVMLGSLGALYSMGYAIEWERIYPQAERCVPLPLYPWQRDRHWLDAMPSRVTDLTPSATPSEEIGDCLYDLLWQLDRDERVQPPPSLGRHWLVFVDGSGVGEALARQIESLGLRCVRVTAGDSYHRVDNDHFEIHPQSPSHLERLFEAAAPLKDLSGIIHLWSLDAAPAIKTTAVSLEIAQTLGCDSVLHLVQQIASARSSELPRLWLVTRGAQAALQQVGPLSVAQAPLWGLGRVIAQEHPALWGGLIDLDPEVVLPTDAAAQLWQWIATPSQDNQVAFRQGQRYVARLARRPQPADSQAPLRLRADRTYLIAGGLGDLGLAVARWMVTQGARRLLLMARTQLPPRARWSSVPAGSHAAHQVHAIREIEALGASVHLASVDIGDEPSLSRLLNDFRTEGWPPIGGVVHAAGVLYDGLLSEVDTASFNCVFRPKVAGAWNLHHVFADTPLDFFVLFSSAGALLGQPGQGSYAAANAFLDSLAYYRRSRGLSALTINWGAWTDLGFANTPGGKRLGLHLASLGIESLAPPKALEVLRQLLLQDATQAIAVSADWDKVRRFFRAGAASPMLSDLSREAPAHDPQGEKHLLARATLLTAEPQMRHRLLQSYLVDQVARVLGCPASRLDLHQPVSTLGLDSLMAVELKNRIAIDLGVDLPMVLFLQGASIDRTATRVLDLLMTEISREPAALTLAGAQQGPGREFGHANGRQSEEQLLSGIDRLSDEEVTSMLTELLAEGGE
jgi:tyrocidine synthetase III